MFVLWLLLASIVVFPASAQQALPPISRQVIGDVREVTVAPGDMLSWIAGRVGVPWRTIADRNHIANPDLIRPGQRLSVDTHRIVPGDATDGVLINVPEAGLYFFRRDGGEARYPVGLGRSARKWQTPLGSFTVLYKESDPTWEVPKSIQEEMRAEGQVVQAKVPPGPDNPLGKYWIQLSAWGYGIHGTPFPSTIGVYVSHGCIRLGDEGIGAVYRDVRRGTAVRIVYEPVKLALTADGEIWAEANRDVYRLGAPGEDQVVAALRRVGVLGRVDLAALGRVLSSKSGVARKIGLPPAESSGAAGTPREE